ncbi:MAG: FAD-binding protein [Paracoccaceae bacterium]|nr:FAD-binding protein [Paracoccaceae bacterium]MDE2916608.1 FAD-binding protein [Paracoccaceae bacterium]
MTIENAKTRLRELFDDRFSTNNSVLELHGADESYFPVSLPDGVVFPANKEEVSQIVTICNEENCPVIPWGVGTSLEGHSLAINGGITIDLGQMKKILEINEEDLNVVVQPGITREELNQELRNTGLFFPIDPGANATLGGMASTRASGTTAVRYGTMKDNILAMEVVLADGKIIRTGTKAKKDSAGYDLTSLFVGSEGTLGIITEITLKLQGQPEAISAAVCAFEDIESAVNSVILIIQMGIPIARIELVDAAMMRGMNLWDKDFNLPETPHLFLEFHGSKSGVEEQSETVGEIISDFGGSDYQWATKTEDRNHLWKARHNAYYAAKSLRPGCKVLTTDSCVPISKLTEAILETVEDIENSPLEGPIVGHVGDGNFHTALLLDPDSPEELAIAKEITSRLNARSLKLGGTITGEHGIGLGKMKYMHQQHGESWILMANIKRTLDPKNILNPGKVVNLN